MKVWIGLNAESAVVKELGKKGLLVKIEPYKHSVGHCYRCKTVVEPNLSKQWFVRVKPLAEKAIAAVENGKTKIIPGMWTNTYYDWMNNIRDWCISRQIWWGHQIPAWTCERVRRDRCGNGASADLPGLRKSKTSAGNRCAGHLVQLCPLALLNHGLAG